MVIDIDPNLHLLGASIAWHGVFTSVGIFAGVWLALRLVRSRVSESAATSVATWGVVGGLIGARALHVFDCWSTCASVPDGYARHLELIPQLWTGGIAVWGAAVGGVLGGLIIALRRGTVPIGYTADGAAAAIAFGFAVGRIGDIINGEHHATACAPPGLCVTYVHPATLGQGPTFAPSDPRFAVDPVHLAVGYDLILNLVGVAGVLALRGRVRDGLVFWLWAVWYACSRFWLGVLRVGDPSYAFGLREDQTIALLVLAAAVPMVVRLTRQSRHGPLHGSAA